MSYPDTQIIDGRLSPGRILFSRVEELPHSLIASTVSLIPLSRLLGRAAVRCEESESGFCLRGLCGLLPRSGLMVLCSSRPATYLLLRTRLFFQSFPRKGQNRLNTKFPLTPSPFVLLASNFSQIHLHPLWYSHTH